MPPSLLLLGSFLLMVACGLPIAFCLGVAAFLTGMTIGIGPAMLVQRISAGIQLSPLIAIPLFILAGGIMARGGVAKRLVDFAYILVGPFRGGLAMVNCIDSMFFGGVSGSALADISSTGPIMIPMMVQKAMIGNLLLRLPSPRPRRGLLFRRVITWSFTQWSQEEFRLGNCFLPATSRVL